ncbi:hypothetical protein WBG78_06940 [Chryseolinea sp. T2]|uniref:hypothetical protein n=1 Tax=Chryseolinea sp. T2 TaxID=3129255 RepID=UPI0030779C11
MKQSFKIIILTLVFILPIAVFVFLKLFGRNEFDVAPLYVSEVPSLRAECGFKPAAPYFVEDSIQRYFNISADSLTVIFFGPLSGEAQNQLDRVREQTAPDPVQILDAATIGVPLPDVTSNATFGTDTSSHQDGSIIRALSPAEAVALKHCVFFLDSVKDVVMLDRQGAIRGQYAAADRDEIDRLLTEITIILKKY